MTDVTAVTVNHATYTQVNTGGVSDAIEVQVPYITDEGRQFWCRFAYAATIPDPTTNNYFSEPPGSTFSRAGISGKIWVRVEAPAEDGYTHLVKVSE